MGKHVIVLTVLVILFCISGCHMKETTTTISKTQKETTTIKEIKEISKLEKDDFSSDFIKWTGRTSYREDGSMMISHSLSGFEVHFKGTELKSKIYSLYQGNYTPTLAISIDGEDNPFNFEKVVIDKLDSKEYVLVSGLENKDHVIKVYKASESQFGNVYFENITTDGVFNEFESKKLKIEVIGDSITCGYGTDYIGFDGEVFTTVNENACKTYEYFLSRMLDADISVLSASGFGMNVGLGENTEMPVYYDFADMIEKASRTDCFVADIVIITLGANDNQYIMKGLNTNERIEEYKAKYRVFIKNILERNPKSKIICLYGFLNETNVYKAIDDIAMEYKVEGLPVYSFQVESAQDFCLDGHPGVKEHLRASSELIDFMISRKIATKVKDQLVID